MSSLKDNLYGEKWAGCYIADPFSMRKWKKYIIVLHIALCMACLSNIGYIKYVGSMSFINILAQSLIGLYIQ